jgi:hypothetical protein
MSERRTLIVTGIVVVLIIALILGVVWYLINFIRNRQTGSETATSDIFPRSTSSIEVSSAPTSSPLYSSTPIPSPTPFKGTNATPSPRPTPTPVATPVVTPRPTSTTVASSPVPTANPNNPATKIFNAQGVTVTYPKTWGLLTCNNSSNFELDPNNGTEQLNFNCNFAVKPITFIVGPKTCTGQTITLGNTKVIKSVRQGTKGTIYEWCTQTTPELSITHRTAATNQPGYSVTNFSAEVENIITNLKFASGS